MITCILVFASSPNHPVVEHIYREREKGRDVDIYIYVTYMCMCICVVDGLGRASRLGVRAFHLHLSNAYRPPRRDFANCTRISGLAESTAGLIYEKPLCEIVRIKVDVNSGRPWAFQGFERRI